MSAQSGARGGVWDPPESQPVSTGGPERGQREGAGLTHSSNELETYHPMVPKSAKIASQDSVLSVTGCDPPKYNPQNRGQVFQP